MTTTAAPRPSLTEMIAPERTALVWARAAAIATSGALSTIGPAEHAGRHDAKAIVPSIPSTPA